LQPASASAKTNKKDDVMRSRSQNGQIVRIGEFWYVRYWERRNVGGVLERRRVTHKLGGASTKHAPTRIRRESMKHMQTVNSSGIQPERIVTIGDFVEGVFLPWVEAHKRPSTSKGYRDIWNNHLKAHCATFWLKEVKTFHVQQWLNCIGEAALSRNSQKHIKSVLSGIFTLAKQQDYFEAENPTRDSAISPAAAEPNETHAYPLEEVQTILALLPEPAATVFAVAAFTGLRLGEIQGLAWPDYRGGELHVSRSIWNGHITAPKTRKGRAPVPVIPALARRLEEHRQRCGNPSVGPIFANIAGKPMNMNNLLHRQILPAIVRCEVCGARKRGHRDEKHSFKRDGRIPEWHGWHAARRGLGSNLYRLGVTDIVIQRILRHANVSTTSSYYIKSAADDMKTAMAKLETQLPDAPRFTFVQDSQGTLSETSFDSSSLVN
jgi:integrase